jgi:hypothetical protein
MSVYGLYGNGDQAQRAVDALRGAGVADADITVVSSEPLEHYEFGRMNSSTWMWYIASAGGFAGMAFGTWLTRFTSMAWPLQTSGMPIVAWWPNLIVIFELTMFGAIFATVATVVISCGLLRRGSGLYDSAVADGAILIGVETPRDAAAIERALAFGGAQVKKI